MALTRAVAHVVAALCLAFVYGVQAKVSSNADNLQGRHLDITVIQNNNMVRASYHKLVFSPGFCFLYA